MLPTRTLRCDVFCKVVDNYGDIGVCWRLARQLCREHRIAVRLWVDDLRSFARICPRLDEREPVQTIDGIEICAWRNDFPQTSPGDIVIETFACRLPDVFVAAMAERRPPPAWVNLDYLSAEPWTSGCHTLPSPDPRLPLTKYFFFPGFDDATTGGLLREQQLDEQRRQFLASATEQAAFWQRLGLSSPAPKTRHVSLFAYDDAPLPALLSHLERLGEAVRCLVPLAGRAAALEDCLGQAFQPGDRVRRGSLELCALPFVAQDDYDRLLWSCDLNFVRGEDSFVRAQWAAQPFVWHIYPQDDAVHRVKLEAFLDRYCADLPAAQQRVLREVFLAWNGFADFSAPLFAAWRALWPEFRAHALAWEKYLSKQQDLCASLVRFCKSKL